MSEVVDSAWGGVRHRCRRCGSSWVTEGSAMDVANELARANRPHDPDA